MRLSPAEAALVVAELGLEYPHVPVCLPCLTFVSFPLADGDDLRARRQAAVMAPDLWAEGLEEPVRVALEEARGRGVDRAAEALVDVELHGPRSEIVRAVVLRLAQAQVEEMRGWARRRRL